MLVALTEIFAAERAAAGDDWRGLVVRLAMTQALDQVEWAATRRMHPRLVVLLVRVGRLTADAAVELLDVCSFAGGEALAQLWRGLSPAGLQAALGRLRWGSYPDVPGDALVEMVARALELGCGEEALARVLGLDEPLRTRVLVALWSALTGELRAEVMAGIEAIEDPFARVGLLREVAPHEGLRGSIEPVCAAEWTRLAAITDAEARCAAWERRISELGPLATLAESRRWVATLRAGISSGADTLYRLQTWVPRALWGEALEGLAPAFACEGMVWLVWGDETADARPALAAVLACAELAAGDRVRLLGVLISRLDGEAAEVAARAMLGSSACTLADAMQAALYLPRAEQAAKVEAWCHDEPFERGLSGHALGWVLAVLARLAEAADEPGRTEIVGLARGLSADWSAAGTGWIDFARWLGEEERVGLARHALIEVKDAKVIGRVIGLVPEGMAVLADKIEEARKIPDAYERWSALGELVAELPEEQGAALLRAAWARRSGEDPREIFYVPDWAMDAGLQRAKVAHELAHPYRPYTPWLLGMYARPLPAAERGPVLDRAIEEFRAIAGAPTSPGNDAGPFVEMADLLDEAQVRRALEVVESMAASAASWGCDLEYSRQALAQRLGELGHLDEAEARIRATSDPASALGTLVGGMLARGTGWEEASARLAGVDVAAALAGLVWTMTPETRAGRVDVVEWFLLWLPQIADAEDREDVLANLIIKGFAAAVPVEAGVAAIREYSRDTMRAKLLLALAKVAGGAVLVEAVAALDDVEDLEDVIDEVCEVADGLATATRISVLTRWLRGLPRRNFSLLWPWAKEQVGLEISAVLRAAGGDAALVTAAREVAAVTRLLA